MTDDSRQIVKVHFKENGNHQLEYITQFMLANDELMTLEDMVFNITLGLEYFTLVDNHKSILETFKLGTKHFVRTKGNQTKIDNLLSLPEF